MKKVEIVKGVYSSVIGFGTAPILGAINAKVAERAINVALDCGINHFDLARSYGYGEAEAFVGNILKNRRSEIVFASKFGIRANWKAQLLKPLKPLVRFIKSQQKIANSVSSSKESVITIADKFHERIPITPKFMLSSLEESLKALKTDYLDILFIHEPLNTVEEIDIILETTQLLKKQGKIRGFGLSFMQEQESIHTLYLSKFDILQFNNSPGIVNYDNLVKSNGRKKNIFFSPLKGGNGLLKPKEKLEKLLLDFPESVVLCSMFDEKHIIANAKLAHNK